MAAAGDRGFGRSRSNWLELAAEADAVIAAAQLIVGDQLQWRRVDLGTARAGPRNLVGLADPAVGKHRPAADLIADIALALSALTGASGLSGHGGVARYDVGGAGQGAPLREGDQARVYGFQPVQEARDLLT